MKRIMKDRISKMVTQREKEYLGRGPLSEKTDIIRNRVIVVLKGILTPTEEELAQFTNEYGRRLKSRFAAI